MSNPCYSMFKAAMDGNTRLADPGNAGTINVDRNPCTVELVSATTETRTLAQPRFSGLDLLVGLKTDGGDLTMTVTGGYNAAGSTDIVFDDAGDYAHFKSISVGSDFLWRLVSFETAAGTAVVLDGSSDYFWPNGGTLVFGFAGPAEVISTGDGATNLTPDFQMHGTTQTDATMMNALWSTTNALGPMYAFVKGGNASIASHTIVADDEYLGRIVAFGDDGVDIETPCAEIRFVVDGTPAADQIGGSIEFYTTPDGSSTLTSVMTVTSGQNVIIHSGNGLNVGSVTRNTISDGDGTTNLIPEVQLHGVGSAFAGGALQIATYNTTNDRTVSPKLALLKGAAATQVATTAVADNEVTGSIISYASDGGDFETPVGAIEFVVDDVGGPGASQIGGSIEFYTTADGGTTLTKALTIDNAQTATFTNGVVVQSDTAAAITTTRALTAADSGGIFTVAKSSAYAITLPTPAQGIRFKFMVLDTGANAVTISNGSAHLFGLVSLNNTNTAMTGTTLSLASGGSVGDWVEFCGIDATHYLVTGACIAAADISIA